MQFSTGFICLALLVLQAQGCTKFSKWWWRKEKAGEYETDDQKVYFSEYVAFGKVLGDVTGNYPYNGIAGVRTVKFKVKCSFKGKQMPEDIFIAGVGNVEGEIAECPKADLKEHDMAVVYLKKTAGNVFEIEYSPLLPQQGIDPVEELTIVCGLNLLFPKGQSIDLQDTSSCYPGATKEEGCVAFDPTAPVTPKPATTATEKVTTQEPKEIETDNNNSGYKTPKTDVVPEPEGNANTGGSVDDNGNGASSISLSVLLIATLSYFAFSIRV